MRGRGLEARDLLVGVLREATHAALLALLGRPVARILEDRLGQAQAVHAAESTGHRQPEVGVARRVGGLELEHFGLLRADRLGAGLKRSEASRLSAPQKAYALAK